MKTLYISPATNYVAFEQKNLMQDYSVASDIFTPAGGGSGSEAV